MALPGPVEKRSPDAGWLAFATGGPVLEACRQVGDAAVVVSTGTAFAAAIATSRPRLVLLAAPPALASDIEMLAAARARRPSIRTILVDEPAAVDERLHALAIGFDEALPDTVPAVELAGRARILLRRSRPHGSRVIQVAETSELDLDAHALRRDGSTVHLRPMEFRLLALFATHPGRAFSRRQLLDRVWGVGHDADPRTVDVHVRWLRSKFEADPERPAHLVTVRGTGYRLDPP